MKNKNNLSKPINFTTVFIFFFIITLGSLLQVVLPDQKLSVIERRRLEQYPKINISKVISSQWTDQLETYLLDQFPLRDEFKQLDAIVKQKLFFIGDIEGVYREGNYLSKILYPLNTSDVIHNANKITDIYTQYLSGLNVFITVVPDKGYFTANQGGYPSVDYDNMISIFRENLSERIQYIDIFPLLSIQDYYYTDAHWRQECILPVAEKIKENMSSSYQNSEPYQSNTFYPFKGVYYGKAADSSLVESLSYLTSESLDRVEVFYQDSDKSSRVYNQEDLKHLDAYDVFLGGPQPVIHLLNPTTQSNRKLVVFRDSFGSSLTPLLLDSYNEITVIDLRYFDESQLNELIKFEDQDVLFVYNTTVINNRVNFK